MMVNELHWSQIVIPSGKVCEPQVLRFAQDDKISQCRFDKMYLSRFDKMYLSPDSKVYLCRELAGYDAGSYSRCVSSRNN